MKKYIVLLSALLAMACGRSQGQSCCKKPEGMQALAFNKAFKEAHLSPIPFNYTPVKGSMISFPTHGGGEASAFAMPADGSSDKVLIIVHEWWGLNDYIKREAEHWYSVLGGKVSVYAVDLYDGKVAANPDEAGKLMAGLTQERGTQIMKGLIAEIGTDKKIATLGWCMGGSWSFAGTLLAGNEATACVMYYGFPDKDKNHIKTLKTDVLYIYGTQDNFIKKTDVEAFGTQVKASGHAFTLYSFDAVHAFANPSNPKYDKDAAGKAEAITTTFLKSKLKLD